MWATMCTWGAAIATQQPSPATQIRPCSVPGAILSGLPAPGAVRAACAAVSTAGLR